MATLIPALGACVSHLGTTQLAVKPTWEIIPDGSPKSVPQPLDQARRPTGACRRNSAVYTRQLRARRQSAADHSPAQPARRGDPSADLLNAAHQNGHACGDLAVICRRWEEMIECAQALGRWQLPHQVRKGSGSFNPVEDTIKVLTMHASKGLEFPVVALMGVGQTPAEEEATRVRQFTPLLEGRFQ
jgi:hypothetical protein